MQFLPFFSPKDPSRPYDFCVDLCPFFNAQKCDGPNFLRAGFPRFVELCILRKEVLRKSDPKKWTNAYIAEKTQLSLTTINRFFAGSLDDLKFTTASQIVNALADGAPAQHPCPMESLTKIIRENGLQELLSDFEAKKEECRNLAIALDQEKAERKNQVDFLRQQLNAKDEQIVEKNKHLDQRAAYMERKDKYLKRMGISLVASVVLLIVACALLIFTM